MSVELADSAPPPHQQLSRRLGLFDATMLVMGGIIGSGIFMKDSMDFCTPAEAECRARAIVRATTHFQDPAVLLEVSADLIGAMKGLAVAGIVESELLQKRSR